MRPRSPAAVLAALVALGCLTTPAAGAASCPDARLKPSHSNAERVRAATLCLLNRERTRRGLRKLRADDALRGAGQRYAKAMVRQRFFDHVSPSGSTLTTRVRATSYPRGARRVSLGENIAWGAGGRATPAAIVDSWMHSAGHRRNILDRSFREIGIGVVRGTPTGRTGGATYVTDFGMRVRAHS